MTDDLDAYLATLTEDEREELAIAEVALGLTILAHRAREYRGHSQAAAASRAGIRQQAVNRFERPGSNVKFETVRRYLTALGYEIEITVIDPATDEAAARMSIPPRNCSPSATK